MKKNIEKTLLLCSLLLQLSSCIALDSKQQTADNEVEDELFLEDEEDFVVEKEDDMIVESSEPILNQESIQETAPDPITLETQDEYEDPNQGNNLVSLTPNTDVYNVQKGDTLMLVAFKLYGDYTQWRKLYELNKGTVGADYDISHRPVLKYYIPDQKFIDPAGRPYFIKKGDSLSRISQKVYGQMEKWPMIFKNNSRQIRDPNLIFAGFTLYYPSQYRSDLF